MLSIFCGGGVLEAEGAADRGCSDVAAAGVILIRFPSDCCGVGGALKRRLGGCADSGDCDGDVLAELCADSEVPSEDWAGFESFASRLLRIFFYQDRCQSSSRVTAGAV